MCTRMCICTCMLFSDVYAYVYMYMYMYVFMILYLSEAPFIQLQHGQVCILMPIIIVPIPSLQTQGECDTLAIVFSHITLYSQCIPDHISSSKSLSDRYSPSLSNNFHQLVSQH